MDLSELAQVLTITAKKLSGLTLGRKWSKTKPGSQSSTRDRRSPEDAKRNTHCSACGQRGHWYQDPECPKNQGKTSSSATSYASSKKSAAPSSSGSSNKPKFAVNLIHHEHGSISIGSHDQEDHQYGQAFSVGMVHHMDTYDVLTSHHEDTFAGFLVLDSGCQRTCCGQKWLHAHMKKLQQHALSPYSFQADDVFQFGKGTPSKSLTRSFLPSGIAGEPLLLGACVLQENIPCLGSNSLLTRLGAVLDLSNDWVTFTKLGVGAKIHRIAGHMAINILNFPARTYNQKTWDELMYQQETPDPEFVVSLNLNSSDSHAPAASSMACSMAEVYDEHSEHVQELPPPYDDDDDQSQGAATRCVAGIPPAVPPTANPRTCQHPTTRRYGNAHGRYAECLTCSTKWKWSQESWVPHGRKERSAHLQPLPPPSSATISQPASSAMRSMRPKALPKPSTRPPAGYPMIGPSTSWTTFRPGEMWTSFNPGDMRTDHLTPSEMEEVVQIISQESPIVEMQHRDDLTWIEEAWLTEDMYLQDRAQREAASNQARWDRLTQLGAIGDMEEEIYEWEEVDESL